jgi:hypothetical protein
VVRLHKARLFNLLALAAGAIGLAILLHQVGVDGIVSAIVDTGAWFAVIALIDVCSMLCDTFAIHGMLRTQAHVSFWRVFGAQASGLAINRLTPGNSIGEAVKVTMLVRYVPTDPAVSTIVTYSLLNMYMGVAAIVIGVPITALLLDLARPVAIAVWIAAGVLVAISVAATLLVRRGALGTLVGAAARLRAISSARAERWRAKVADIDDRMRSTRGLSRGIAGVFGSRVFNWIGTVVVLHAVGIPLTA